jgi:hypothetical protein
LKVAKERGQTETVVCPLIMLIMFLGWLARRRGFEMKNAGGRPAFERG